MGSRSTISGSGSVSGMESATERAGEAGDSNRGNDEEQSCKQWLVMPPAFQGVIAHTLLPELSCCAEALVEVGASCVGGT